MRYENTITISKAEADEIKRYLTVEPTCEEECLDEDDTIIYTAVFDNDIEVDVKCCGVQFDDPYDWIEPDEDIENWGGTNLAWAEAVMFKNGSEVCCVNGDDAFFGEWEFEYDGNEYIVFVEAAAN